MNIRFGISRNTVYLLPTLSVGTDDVMNKRVYWINLAFLSFDILIIFGVLDIYPTKSSRSGGSLTHQKSALSSRARLTTQLLIIAMRLA
jgi:hypothetical protein